MVKLSGLHYLTIKLCMKKMQILIYPIENILKVVKSTLNLHITPVIKSITGSNTIFISYPILGNQTENNISDIIQKNDKIILQIIFNF